ncbi:DUF5719 family protein [Arthrobacter sp. S41]|uniref:DUF5719 family protein n=1 Tax=Arthrobacter sp. S41 TaxID=2509721 RepID=UPI001036BB5D|nr:DUF5719 family protein [Arthrobacter sp. S41]TAP25852.1 hypothetical protein EYR88_12905 [Arthrobacter sp. S41]
MSDEKNVNSADSADKPESKASEQSKHPMSAALTRAEEKAAKIKAKIDAKLDKARAKEATQRAKADAKNAAESEKVQKAQQEADAKAEAKAEKARLAQQEADAAEKAKAGKKAEALAAKQAEAEQKAAAKAEKKPTAQNQSEQKPAVTSAPVADPDKAEKSDQADKSAKDEKSETIQQPETSQKSATSVPLAVSNTEPANAPAQEPAKPVAAQKPEPVAHKAEEHKHASHKAEEPSHASHKAEPQQDETSKPAQLVAPLPASQQLGAPVAADKASDSAATKDPESAPQPAKSSATPAAGTATVAGATAAAGGVAASNSADEKNQVPAAQEPEDAQAAKRRRKLEKIRAAEAAKEEQSQKSEAVATVPASEPKDSKVSARRRKLEKARIAASKDAATAPTRKKTGAVLLSLAAVVAACAVVGGGSIIAPKAAESTLPAAVTNLPAGDATSICASTPQLLKGVDGTDPQFAAGAKNVNSNVRSIAVSDLAKRIPGSSVAKLDGSSPRTLTKRIKEAEAVEARGADDAGQTGRVSKISTLNNVEGIQSYSLQPLGGLASEGSALRSYQASDGDLEGLATATCQAPASNWRFTGLQTSTGSTSVMHLSNPTHTTAQVALQLRGPDGLIDTPTLQSIVLAPGEDKALVLGGYAQNMGSVSAEVTSVGGKITATVQQAALRGLTPSGVDFVGANASASNSQVIPGVWIDSKENISSLSKDDSSLVPQLHVSATGSSGAGYKVKVLGENGEVAASFDENLAAASNATSVVDLKQLAGGYYTVVVESDAPVTAAVRMVRGANPKDSSDTAWAASSNVLAGTQAMPISANGTGKFALAAVDSDSSVEATVVTKDGKLQKAKKLQIDAGSSIVFDPKSVSDDGQAVIFSTDANTYIAQVALGSDRSIAWAAMPQANAGRDGIVVNIGG